MKAVHYNFSGFSFLAVLLTVVFQFQVLTTQAQLSLSGGFSFSHAPTLRYGNANETGNLFDVFADLQYKQVIGRAQYSSVLTGSVDSGNMESGYGIHGSIGYSLPVTERLELPLMLTGGAAILTFNNGFSGSFAGDIFTDASPQFGVTISPHYRFTDHITAMGALRYLKGFETAEGNKAIDLLNLSVGIRLTL